MRVGVLGPLVVDLDDGPISPRGQRPRDVLTVLVQRRGHVVAPDVVLDRVWGEAARELSPAAVHTVVARLRRHLGPGLVETLDSGYRLGREVTVDVDDFDAATRRARAAATTGDLETTVTAYRQAAAVWRGREAFEGASDDLVTGDRSRLGEARAQVLEELAAALLSSGAPTALEESLALAHELLAEHPLREGPHRTAMLATFGLGRQAEALEVFRDLRRRLRAELGIEPSAATAAVHQRILSQDPTLVPEAPPQPPARPVSSGRVPIPPTRTVGRERELDTVSALLADGRRLVTILGPGGVGKSRLLTEIGVALQRGDPGGRPDIVYIDLSGLGESGPVDIAEAVASAFALRVGPDDPVTGLAEALADAHVIALVDEAEWAATAVAEVASRLVAHCPGVQLVVTSRVPLEVLGESRVLLGPLACPDEDAVGRIARTAPAVRLLEARLRDHAPDLVLEDSDGLALARIARRVDGLPLALELVAGYAASHTLAELVPLVEAPLDVVSDEHGLRPRHRSLRDMLLWSLERLSPTHRTVLRRLGVFAGSVEVSTARAVVGGGLSPHVVEAALRTLVREALVQRDGRGSRTRIRLLRTVRDQALEELAEHGELDDVRRRHREWYAARWRGTPPSDDLLLEVAESYDDYVEALRRALEARDAASVGALAVTLERRWNHDDSVGVAIRWLDRILDARLLTGRDRARVVIMRCGQGLIADRTEDLRELTEIESELADDPPWLAQCLNIQSVHHYVRGAHAQAVAATTRLVEVAQAAPEELLPRALATHGVTLAAAGEHPAAVAAATEAWTSIRAAPTSVQLTTVVSKVGMALTDSGAHAQALRVLTYAIDALDHRAGFAPKRSLYMNAGWAALGVGDPGQALTLFTRSLDSTIGLPPGVFAAEECSGAACALAGLGDPDSGRMLALAVEMCRRRGLVLTPTQQGHVDRARALAGGPVHRVEQLPDAELALTIHASARAAAARVAARSAGSPAAAALAAAR